MALLGSRRLTIWATCVFVVALGMLFANMFAFLRRPVTSRGIPWVATVLAVLSGVAFGFVPWLDIDAVREQSATIAVVAVLLGASALSAGAMTGAVGLGRLVIYPMWILAAAAMFYIGEYGYGAAGLAFMFLLGRDMTSTRDLLFEILYQREQSQDQAQHAQMAAHRDPLTGLLNRAGLEAATAATAASASTITVMFIDLDHFKSVNDRFGHAAGDELLKEVGERLLRTVRPGDIFARLGGDEFLLVFLDELTEPVRDRLASAVISNLELPFEIGNLEARISASLGITVVAAEAFDLGAVQR
ncbi:MAG: diguanylate cyclase domain-containing protein, partial [Acidimicrobiales bacterium]